uniref:Protein kinase domain-containing protein n=2 Tax=Caenorhabditis japonica TaxID=281687 RepID=A0A8R1DPS7_CAEJA
MCSILTDEEEDDTFIKPGFELVTPRNTYMVGQLLGVGGFGDVFQVSCKDKDGQTVDYALKVEKQKENRHSKLKMEIAILKACNDCNHFTKIVDRGKRDELGGYFFIIMELVGKTIGDMAKKHPNGVFSFVTALGVGSQCLEGIESLHKHEYIHRDIKPANFAIGLPPKQHIVYVLDFGIARKFTNFKNEVKTPRQRVAFKGTLRFCALACHQGVELGRKDDCESILYLILSVLVVGGLPWDVENRHDVWRIKEECRREKRSELFRGIRRAKELHLFMDYIDSLAYQDQVDYDFLYKILALSCTEVGADINDPYEWESMEDVKKRKKKTNCKKKEGKKISKKGKI